MKTIVIKIGGAAVDRALAHAALWKALASIHAGPSARVVVVHGGGAIVDARIERLGLATARHNGLRITPDDQIDEVVAALAGIANLRLAAALRSAGVDAIGLTLSDGGTLNCTRMKHPIVDLGRVGEARPGNPELLLNLLQRGSMPVLSSIGVDSCAEPLNVNADHAASAVAAAIGAEHLIFLTETQGILDAHGRTIREIDHESFDALVREGIVRTGMQPKGEAALSAADALAGLGARIAIASSSDPSSIERILQGDAAGATRIMGRTPTDCTAHLGSRNREIAIESAR